MSRAERQLRAELRPSRRPSVVTIGTFDGVHAGHRALVGRTRDLARERGLGAIAVTFSPRPEVVLAPTGAMPDLCSPLERGPDLRQLGGDVPALRALGIEVVTPPLVRGADGSKLSSSTMRVAALQAASTAEA